MTREVFIVSAARSAIGTYGGTLKDTPLVDLATTIVKAALERSGFVLDIEPVTATHPISGGKQPAMPPQTMFCQVRRFSHIV